MTTKGHCSEYAELDRRTFLSQTLQATAGLFAGKGLVALPRWMPHLRLADPHVGPRGDTLVCVFLRGGADGLNIVVPHGDDSYYAQRPTLAIPRPDDRQAEVVALDLDGFFGLHPALAPLHELYSGGDLAVVHATGSPDESRSHFEAMDLMERGAETGAYSGWLARHLATLETGNESALRAVAIGDMLPASLSGTVSATALQTIGDYHLRGTGATAAERKALLEKLYGSGDDLLSQAARRTFSALEVLEKVDDRGYRPAGREYPEADFGRGLRTVAQLIKAQVGVEVACLDLGGWDTHVAQAGLLANNLSLLAGGLRAFYEDLEAERERVVVVVMSEFGRRVRENSGLGTDHGHGNMMIVVGGGVAGGQVFADWPGLHPEQLAGPGDLSITTDYRDVLGELLRRRLNNPRLAEVFPDHVVREQGIFGANS